jgi:hypothetical protein
MLSSCFAFSSTSKNMSIENIGKLGSQKVKNFFLFCVRMRSEWRHLLGIHWPHRQTSLLSIWMTCWERVAFLVWFWSSNRNFVKGGIIILFELDFLTFL